MRGKFSPRTRGFVVAAVLGLVAATPFTMAAAAPQDDGVAPLTVTAAQERVLDQQIAAEMARAPGGERISVNQIAWDRKGAPPVILTLPLPGERIARAAGEPVTALGTPNCNYEGVCLWDYTNFEGARLGPFYACRTETLSAHGFANRTESWHNNQTPNTKSWLVQNGQILMDMIPNSKVSHVGVYNVNRATHLTVC